VVEGNRIDGEGRAKPAACGCTGAGRVKNNVIEKTGAYAIALPPETPCRGPPDTHPCAMR
jgi:hypothetical protein